MTVIGYMRVSTHHQKFDSQERALKKYGVDHIFKEYESGRKTSRSELDKALSLLKEGDTLVIFKLDRLSRGTKQLLTLLEEFNQKGIHFVSIQNNIDTSTAMGKFFFTVMSAFAEMEAELIRERVMAGLEVAKENGKRLGRPPKTQERELAIKMYQSHSFSVSEIAEKTRLSLPSVYKIIHTQKEEEL
ncbi:recombinase family protein [Enterococcus termitis]|uniref:Resolvase n=1 Tax=Enterococcus termitis TaxID=332950 RepID=A0A1E5GHS4_9ENTE|nr:recombinase family protein [Enterococcus termitis]OEG12283.1 resolvase [Enterococcus termitis]